MTRWYHLVRRKFSKTDFITKNGRGAHVSYRLLVRRAWQKNHNRAQEEPSAASKTIQTMCRPPAIFSLYRPTALTRLLQREREKEDWGGGEIRPEYHTLHWRKIYILRKRNVTIRGDKASTNIRSSIVTDKKKRKEKKELIKKPIDHASDPNDRYFFLSYPAKLFLWTTCVACTLTISIL